MAVLTKAILCRTPSRLTLTLTRTPTPTPTLTLTLTLTKVALSYTIEASYAGPASGPHVDTHFSTRQLCAQGELLHPLTTPHPSPCY